jgi:hypothetical protein
MSKTAQALLCIKARTACSGCGHAVQRADGLRSLVQHASETEEQSDVVNAVLQRSAAEAAAIAAGLHDAACRRST